MMPSSTSPWASPIVLVRKKDVSTRFCVDYRKLNDVTKEDSYPLPRIDDTLDTLSGNKWFSTLDLKSGYWQVEIYPEDREKIAFTTGKGDRKIDYQIFIYLYALNIADYEYASFSSVSVFGGDKC